MRIMGDPCDQQPEANYIELFGEHVACLEAMPGGSPIELAFQDGKVALTPGCGWELGGIRSGYPLLRGRVRPDQDPLTFNGFSTEVRWLPTCLGEVTIQDCLGMTSAPQVV